jgi:OmpA-OmpF porin, OOP family
MKKALVLLFIIAAAAVFAPVKAAGDDAGTHTKLPYKVKLKYADELFKVGNYFQAMDVYLDLTNDKPTNYYLTYQLAHCYLNARDYKQAESNFKKVIDAASGDYPLAQYYYAKMLKMQGRYDEAKAAFGKFASSTQSDANKGFVDKAKKEIEACDFAKEQVANPTTYQVTHIPANLNKPFTEFAPKVHDGQLYYASLNTDSILNGPFYGKKMILSHIYKADGSAGNWTQGKPLASPLNTDAEHTGNPSFSEDGKRLYFTKCTANGERDIKCKIYVSQKVGDKWSTPTELGSGVNNGEANNTHPAVAKSDAADADILYFASNRKGGYGGYDIYYAEVKHSGTSGAANNAGGNINTADDEITPYYQSKSGLLYFSSNGHIGLGGFDIFSAKGAKDAFEKPVNAGYPLNSSADDTYFTSGEEKKVVYLVSNRPGIIGEKSETCCDDIFRGFNNYVPKFAVSGNLTQKHEGQENPLTGVKITITDVTDGKEKIVKKDSLVSASSYLYDLEPEKKYNIKYQRKDHFPEYLSVSTMGLDESQTFTHHIALNKIVKNKAYNLARIFYDYKSAALREESKVVLDTLYMMLLENPDMVIELSSHTDSIGSDSYNMTLSQGRAQSCVNYLISKGLPKERVIAKGYGETQPVAPNSLGKGKDNPEGRQKNRRTEYKIIGELKNKDDKIIFK